MDDVDNLEGQALVDAAAVEVMGWFKAAWPNEDLPENFWWMASSESPVCPVVEFRPLSSWSDFGTVAEKMAETHHWVIKSPFGPGDPWFMGLTPHGVTGWNGRPDAESSAPAFGVAGLRAALKAVRARRADA